MNDIPATAPPATVLPATALPIEDYALIGDCSTAALVGRNGSIDWLCWPRFDSGACFAALLGNEQNGRFLLAPTTQSGPATRHYRDGSLVLETVFDTPDGQVAVIDFMVPESPNSCIVRIVEGRRGAVPMRMELALRFDYGNSVPWVTKRPGGNGIVAIAGPQVVVLRTNVPIRGESMQSVADFSVAAGERAYFVLTQGESHLPMPPSVDVDDALYATEQHWAEWSKRLAYDGPWAHAVRRSLLTLKCLTFTQTGPRPSAARATGTTGSAGCATPPSPCSPSCPRGTTMRPSPGPIGCTAASPAARTRCRSCTASPASVG